LGGLDHPLVVGETEVVVRGEDERRLAIGDREVAARIRCELGPRADAGRGLEVAIEISIPSLAEASADVEPTVSHWNHRRGRGI
jgi:hypothetical protein